MKLITKAIERVLRAQYETAADTNRPVLKLFTPDARATWLISEMGPDGDTLFGLADLGMGSPEIGWLSLSELQSVRGKFGLSVERDMYFTPDKSLIAYAEEARAAGHIRA